MRKNLIFFGGTFDPPHAEHVAMVKACSEEFHPDKIIIMPTFIPPHKKTFMTASPTQRLEMCKIAFSNIENVEISDWELKKGGKSYSYLTMEHLAKCYKGYDIFFLMGTDMLSSFHTWKNPNLILKYATPLLCVRSGEGQSADQTIKGFKSKFFKEVECLNYIGKEVSSTDVKIRKLLRLPTDNLLNNAINEYIDQHLLYDAGKLSKFLSENLKYERLVHTKGVIALSIKYAKMLKVDLNKTVISAMLHDVAKYLNPEDYKDFKMPKGVPNPVKHQYLGAYIAEKELGITNKEILTAIRYHTSGKPKMSKLSKIIFTADILEEGRTFDGVKEMREISLKDFDKGFLIALERCLEYLVIRNEKIYYLTKSACNYYKKLNEINKNF